MKGAIIGDIVGSIYEWHNIKTKDFPLFAPNCFFTDDSIMTLAVGRAFLNCTDEAMRCSPAGMIASSLEEAEDLGQRTAEVTHNHPEGIKAARVTAGLVYLGREGRSMDELRAYAEAVYEIPTCDAIRSWYEFDETCQGPMPAVFAAFFDSTGFEDAIRNAISVGGDSEFTGAAAHCQKKKDTHMGVFLFLERATRLELASRHPTNGCRHSQEPCLTS